MSETAPVGFAEALETVYKGPDGPKRIEQLVIRLLGRLLSEKNASLAVTETDTFDAIAPTGVEDLPGPTIIEITHTLRRVKSPRFVPDLQKAIAQHKAKSILLVGTKGL